MGAIGLRRGVHSQDLKEDLENVGSNFDGAPNLEFRLATEALELEKSGLGYQRIPPDYRFPYGHTHKKQKEVYVVPPGPEGLEILVIGAPNLSEAPREDVDGQRDWWAD